MENEVLKPIKGYEGIYDISNKGRVYSVRTRKYLKSKPNTRGYMQVDLCVNGIHKMAFVHRLVADAFLDNPHGYPQVNHKDENILNNQADNLEWCTPLHNLLYGTRVERIVQHHKKAVEQLDMIGNVIRRFESLADAEKLCGYNHANISNCCNGKIKSAYGFRWRFVAEV